MAERAGTGRVSEPRPRPDPLQRSHYQIVLTCATDTRSLQSAIIHVWADLRADRTRGWRRAVGRGVRRPEEYALRLCALKKCM